MGVPSPKTNAPIPYSQIAYHYLNGIGPKGWPWRPAAFAAPRIAA
jgi:hypothetical protein